MAAHRQCTIGGVGTFPIDFLTTAILNGRVRFRCCDDVLTVLDAYAWESGPEVVLPNPLAGKRKEVLSQDFFSTAYFRIEDRLWDVVPNGTCATIRLGATFRLLKDVKGAVQGAEVDASGHEKDCLVRVTSAFQICCCTEEATNDAVPKCSWSSDCIDFNDERLDGELPSVTGTKLDWRLDADVGSCGKVGNQKNIRVA